MRKSASTAPATPPWVPDWRDERAYAPLAGAEKAAMAWEWLRRDEDYRTACTAAVPRGLAPRVLAADHAAKRWGLHAFEDPALGARAARPVWRREWLGRVLPVAARTGGPVGDRFDLAPFAGMATAVRGAAGSEHLLLSNGMVGLRLDVTSGSLLDGPVHLAYGLAGLAPVHAPLHTLRGLLHLWQSGRLPPASAVSRNRRLILLLRAHDAAMAGATQREIAEVLLSAEAGRTRWRTEVPSVRLQAQRLAKGALAMARGRYRELLNS